MLRLGKGAMAVQGMPLSWQMQQPKRGNGNMQYFSKPRLGTGTLSLLPFNQSDQVTWLSPKSIGREFFLFTGMKIFAWLMQSVTSFSQVPGPSPFVGSIQAFAFFLHIPEQQNVGWKKIVQLSDWFLYKCIISSVSWTLNMPCLTIFLCI